MIRIFRTRQERLNGCINDSNEKNEGDDDNLDENEIETLFLGFRLDHHTNDHAHRETRYEKEKDFGGATKIVRRIEVTARRIGPNTADDSTDEGSEEDRMNKTDKAVESNNRGVIVLPRTDPLS